MTTVDQVRDLMRTRIKYYESTGKVDIAFAILELFCDLDKVQPSSIEAIAERERNRRVV